MATSKQITYILDLLRKHSDLHAEVGVVTYPMVQAGLARRKEMNTPLQGWAKALDKTDASWVIGKLTEVAA